MFASQIIVIAPSIVLVYDLELEHLHCKIRLNKDHSLLTEKDAL